MGATTCMPARPAAHSAGEGPLQQHGRRLRNGRTRFIVETLGVPGRWAVGKARTHTAAAAQAAVRRRCCQQVRWAARDAPCVQRMYSTCSRAVAPAHSLLHPRQLDVAGVRGLLRPLGALLLEQLGIGGPWRGVGPVLGLLQRLVALGFQLLRAASEVGML